MNKKIYFFIAWILAVVGALSVVPYVLAIKPPPSTISIPKMVFIGTGQAALFLGLICWLSYLILPKTDLHPFVATKPLKRIVYPGLIWGVIVGLGIFVTNKLVILDQKPLDGNGCPFCGRSDASCIFGVI